MIFSHTGTLKIHLEAEAGTTIPNVYCVDNNNDLSIETWELFRAIIACGTPPIDYLPKTTFYRIREIEFKRAIMDFDLSVENGYLVWDEPRIETVDQTEQNAIRYYIGMWMTWIIANRLYGIDFLCHYKRFCKETNCSYERNEKPVKIGRLPEPDLIGFNNKSGKNEYSIFEAKGGKTRKSGTIRKAVTKQLPIVHSIDRKNLKVYILGYAVCEGEYMTPGDTIHNLVKVIVAESNSTRKDAYDIISDKNSASPMYVFEKFILDLYEEVGEAWKIRNNVTDDGSITIIFDGIDVTDASTSDKVILNISYDKMRSVDVILDQRTGTVSVVEHRDVSDAGDSAAKVSIVKEGVLDYITPQKLLTE